VLEKLLAQRDLEVIAEDARRTEVRGPALDLLLGIAYGNVGRYAEAEILFQRSWQHTPTPQLGGLTAATQVAQGRTGDARTTVERALRLPGPAWPPFAELKVACQSNEVTGPR
jgi:hypothetical protein